ncbi:MAG: hypothetical protein JO145_02450 [Acidobacteriaceae bacterium]|nr:hypothetical protein [Acidobacteriaceae bacterium]MBV9764880.1 hypothetical protein [Acidobacteriaceae bacterium]
MKYRVVFRERSNQEGEQAGNPATILATELDDETVLDAVFVGRNAPDAQHSSEVLEEDDDFLSLTTEVWEYDVADGKDEDFKNALRNSAVVLEFEPLEDSGEIGLT